MSATTTSPTPDATPPDSPKTFMQKYGHYIWKLVALLVGAGGSAAVLQPSSTSSGCKCPAPAPAVKAETKADAEPPKADEAPLPGRPRRYGWRPSAVEPEDKVFAAPAVTGSPPMIDLTVPPAPAPFEPPNDQGDLGACGPNAVQKLLIFIMLKDGATKAPVPSRQYMYYNTRALMGTTEYDSGVSNRTMMRALSQYGWCDEPKWPYLVDRFQTRPTTACYNQGVTRRVVDYLSVPQSLQAMKACLADHQPFLFGFSVYESFESAAVSKTGVVPMPRPLERVLGGHDVLIVGYDDHTQRFKFLNSWGRGWGNKGYGTIPYIYATNPGLAGDFWTVHTTPAKLVPPGPDERLGLGRPEHVLAY